MLRVSNRILPGSANESDEDQHQNESEFDLTDREEDRTPSPRVNPSLRTAIAGGPGASEIADPGVTFIPSGKGRIGAMRKKLRHFIHNQKEKKTPLLLREIWKSDYSIAAFVPMTILFYAMKDTGIPFLGVLFFMLAMATVDAILSIFVVRLSFHQNKHGFYRTEDYERDWLRYRVLLTMTKGALFFVIGMSCGWTAIVGAHITWFFTSCQRLRYVILRWSMDDHYPDLQKWSVFALLREFNIGPTVKAFNLVALVGALLGLGITLIPW